MSDRLSGIRSLLGEDAVLLPIKHRQKGPRWDGWSTVTKEKMSDPDFRIRLGGREIPYREALSSGNVGVLLGRASRGICSIDFDGDEFAEAFLRANPGLLNSLRTKGSRGCNVWVRMLGEYPPLSRIFDGEGRPIGEWRSDGGQTVIMGEHPNGNPYQMLVEAPPAEVAFGEIAWPEGMNLKATGAKRDPSKQSGDPTARQGIAEELLGKVEWTTPTHGWCKCPGGENHTQETRHEHTCVYLDSVPTIWCFHSSCSREIEAANRALRARVFDAESVKIPDGVVTWEDAAKKTYETLGRTGRFYLYADRVACVESGGLQVLDEAGATSRVDGAVRFMCRKKEEWVPAAFRTDWARVLLAAAGRSALPEVRSVLGCPTLYRDGLELKVATRGYCGAARAYVEKGLDVPDVPLEEAKVNLRLLIEETAFQSPGDRSRAMASLITPALLFAGLLGGRAPVDAAEADKSQSGKTYRQRVIAALYGRSPEMVMQHPGRGVGSLEESLGNALIRGNPFIQLDNFRGRISSPIVESFMTATDPTQFRLPHVGYLTVDPANVVLMVTSNGLELTRDLANRCSIVRITRQEGKLFKRYGGLDLLGHVRANQGLFLGSAFAVVREWWKRGCPEDPAAAAGHPYGWWSGKLDPIVRDIMGEAPLLEGHGVVQGKATLANEVWAMGAATVVSDSGDLGNWMGVADIAGVCENAGIGVTGADDTARLQKVGRMLMGLFRKGNTEHSLGIYSVHHATKSIPRDDGKGYREKHLYAFTKTGDPIPTIPVGIGGDSASAHNRTLIEVPPPIGGTQKSIGGGNCTSLKRNDLTPEKKAPPY